LPHESYVETREIVSRGRRRLSVCFVAAAFVAAPAGASAATITVDATHDLSGSFDDPGGCTLRDAITAANTNAPFSECPGDDGGGTGNDTILLQGGETYALTHHAAPENANASGDLDITGGGGTTIRATGTGLATIDADSGNFPGPVDSTRGRALDILGGAGKVTLERVRVINGSVTDGTGGGGIRTDASLALVDSEVSFNSVGLFGTSAGNGGGGIWAGGGSLTLTRSTVDNNLVKANSSFPNDSSRGGGITFFSPDGDLNATNTTISGNRVDSSGNTVNTTYAGGIYWLGFGRAMNLTNVTISNNSAIGGGAGAVFGAGMVLFEEDATLTNTILAGNIAPSQADCAQVNPEDDWISGGNNVIGDTSGCGVIGGSNDAFNASPALGPLSNYGGLTRTQLPNPGSPAIDRGGSCPETDQRGFFREPAAPCDSGAVEVGASPTPPVSNDFDFRRTRKNKRKGTAKLIVAVEAAGKLKLTGGSVKRSSARAEKAGKVALAVKPKGAAKRSLRQDGKTSVVVSVTFTPRGGEPNTEATKVGLVKR